MAPSMSAGRSLRLVLLFALMALFAGAALAESGDEDEGPVMEDGMELGKKQRDALPDTSDPAQKKILKCGICQNSVLQMLYNLLRVETEEGRKLTETEVVEILESTCQEYMDGYGLLLDEAGNPTHNWSNDERHLKAKGGWITRLAQGVCNDIYNDHEDYLLEEGPKTCRIVGNNRRCKTAKVVRRICEDGFKWCPKGTVPDDSDEALKAAADAAAAPDAQAAHASAEAKKEL